MSKKTFYVLMAVSMVSSPCFSAQERVVTVQNSVRLGYDDNLYLRDDAGKEGSGYITDILTINGKFNISGRTKALLFWQPEVRYRFDADPKTVTYQDLYAKLDHAMSERSFLTISDRFRYQQKDAQSGAAAGVLNREDENFIENDLKGAVGVDVGELSQVRVGAGYLLRKWDDSTYGQTLGNDFDRYNLNGSYQRQLNQNTTVGVLTIDYIDQQYDGNRGGYDAVSFIGGVDQVFNPQLNGFGRVGATVSSVDTSTGSSDNTSPYLDLGLTYDPSERTTVNGSLGYRLSYAENSLFNAQDEFNVRVGVRHDVTAKINLASTIAYIFSFYDSAYSRFGIADAEDGLLRFNLRASYQINRNNFVEAGYEYSKRSTDSNFLSEYTRNTVDIGWRLRL